MSALLDDSARSILSSRADAARSSSVPDLDVLHLDLHEGAAAPADVHVVATSARATRACRHSIRLPARSSVAVHFRHLETAGFENGP